MDSNRKLWNDRHKELRHALEKSGDRKSAIRLFLRQHAAVHAKNMSGSRVYSFADEVLDNLSQDTWRFIPRGGNHSIAWVIWHLARIEDVTMNILVADKSQVLHDGGWLNRFGINVANTGNGMTDHDVVQLSNEIDIGGLVEYRLSVGRETREIVKNLKVADYKCMVNQDRIKRIWDEGAMLPKGRGIADYWAMRTIAGLLLMPPTRHCFLHLSEARKIKSKADKQVVT